MTTVNDRTADYPIEPMFLERWSPRAFTGEAISQEELLSMLEAARWAASSYNLQPWRFVFARRGTACWENILTLLIPHNQSWAKTASALVIVVSKSMMRLPRTETDVPSPTHSFDTGTATGYFVLQAHKMGWFTHGMVGFDKERAVAELNVPEGYTVEAAYAVGRIGDPSMLPEALRAREHPSSRLPLAQLAFEGAFPDHL